MSRFFSPRFFDSRFSNRVGRGVTVLWAILTAVLVGPNLMAQTNVQKAPLSNRWLFIVDTSRGMAGRSEAARRAVVSMLAAGVNGQMRDGDTVGLWTFSNHLSAGRLPLQVWTHKDRESVAQRVYEYLKAQKCEHQGSLGAIMPSMKQVIRDSDYLTIILVSDGEETVHGTPFDRQINATYQTWKAAQQKAQMPFVTLLRSEHGRIIHYVVNMPPWPLKVPPLPAVLAPTNRTPRQAIPQPLKKTATKTAPLIVRGPQSEPSAVARTAPSKVAPSSSPAKNVSKEIPAGLAESKPKQIAAYSAATPSPTKSVPNLSAPAKSAPASTKATVAKASPPSTTEKAKFAARIAQPSKAAPRVETKMKSSAPASKRPAFAPAHRVNKARTMASKTATEGAAGESSTSAPSNHVAKSKVAMAAPTANVSNSGDNWILVLGSIALLLAATALAIVIVLVRRVRAQTGASLITRSLDREGK